MAAAEFQAKRKEKQMELFKNFWKEEEGQDLIEYALLLGFISLVVVGTLQAVGGAVNNKFLQINTQLASAS